MKMTRSLAALLGEDEPTPPAPDQVEERFQIVQRLNGRHAFIAGKGVLREADDGSFTIETVRQFHDWYANDCVWSKLPNGADKSTPVSQIWMQSTERRQYDSIAFDPRSKSPDVYNLWRGFDKHPRGEQTCERLLDHIFENVARGDQAHYDWILGWMAHIIQHPDEKPGTALVLKGGIGVGKTSVGEHLGALMSRHYATVSTPRQLTGQFNSHMAHALLVQLEESFWSGDKIAENALKHLITGPSYNLEKKGHDVIQLRSFHRYFITSNEKWTVPARHDERRYAIFHVGTARQKDGDYFEAMKREMLDGGYRDLLRRLRRFDLSSVDVRTIPQTKALAAEKITGLKGVAAWWHEVLKEGELATEQQGTRLFTEPKEWRSESICVRSDDLRDEYKTWLSGRRHHGDLPTADAFGRDLHDMCDSITKERRREGGKRPYFYELPKLAKCRAEFEKWLDSKVDWA